jgi:hypothetical protein
MVLISVGALACMVSMVAITEATMAAGMTPGIQALVMDTVDMEDMEDMEDTVVTTAVTVVTAGAVATDGDGPVVIIMPVTEES